MENKKGYVYILANKTNTTLYVGVTSNIEKRMYEHKNHLVSGFTDRYNVTKLVYVEEYVSIYDAICREKSIKNLLRRKKEELINSINPEWKDLMEE